MVFLLSPLGCKLAAGLGSRGGGKTLGLEEVVEVLILQRATLPDIEAVHQREGEEEEEEEGKALMNSSGHFFLEAVFCLVHVWGGCGSVGLKPGPRTPH